MKAPWRYFPWAGLTVPSFAWSGVFLWDHRWKPLVLLWIWNVTLLLIFWYGAKTQRDAT